MRNLGLKLYGHIKGIWLAYGGVLKQLLSFMKVELWPSQMQWISAIQSALDASGMQPLQMRKPVDITFLIGMLELKALENQNSLV